MRMVIHRSALAMLALMGACGISATVADSPPSPAATPAAADATSAAAPAASQPAATPATQNAAATATASAKPADTAKATESAQEKALLDAGYKPEMQHGQKVWCRREANTGSRVSGKWVCGAADQIAVVGSQTRQDISDSQKKLNTYPTH